MRNKFLIIHSVRPEIGFSRVLRNVNFSVNFLANIYMFGTENTVIYCLKLYNQTFNRRNYYTNKEFS